MTSIFCQRGMIPHDILYSQHIYRMTPYDTSFLGIFGVNGPMTLYMTFLVLSPYDTL